MILGSKNILQAASEPGRPLDHIMLFPDLLDLVFRALNTVKPDHVKDVRSAKLLINYCINVIQNSLEINDLTKDMMGMADMIMRWASDYGDSETIEIFFKSQGLRTVLDFPKLICYFVLHRRLQDARLLVQSTPLQDLSRTLISPETFYAISATGYDDMLDVLMPIIQSNIVRDPNMLDQVKVSAVISLRQGDQGMAIRLSEQFLNGMAYAIVIQDGLQLATQTLNSLLKFCAESGNIALYRDLVGLYLKDHAILEISQARFGWAALVHGQNAFAKWILWTSAIGERQDTAGYARILNQNIWMAVHASNIPLLSFFVKEYLVLGADTSVIVASMLHTALQSRQFVVIEWIFRNFKLPIELMLQTFESDSVTGTNLMLLISQIEKTEQPHRMNIPVLLYKRVSQILDQIRQRREDAEATAKLEADLRILLFGPISKEGWFPYEFYMEHVYTTPSTTTFYQIMIHAQRFLTSQAFKDLLVEVIYNSEQDIAYLIFNEPSFIQKLTEEQLEAAAQTVPYLHSTVRVDKILSVSVLETLSSSCLETIFARSIGHGHSSLILDILHSDVLFSRLDKTRFGMQLQEIAIQGHLEPFSVFLEKAVPYLDPSVANSIFSLAMHTAGMEANVLQMISLSSFFKILDDAVIVESFEVASFRETWPIVRSLLEQPRTGQVVPSGVLKEHFLEAISSGHKECYLLFTNIGTVFQKLQEAIPNLRDLIRQRRLTLVH
jgi:hypothetical protein